MSTDPSLQTSVTSHKLRTPAGPSERNNQLRCSQVRTRRILHWPGGWVMKTLSLPLVFLLFPYLSSAQAPKSMPPPKTGECKISGMVVKLAGSEPLKNARVQLLSQDNRAENHSAVTDAGGRFDLRGLDPGRYRLVVHRDGFVTQAYGQKKPNDPGALLTLRARQEVKD